MVKRITISILITLTIVIGTGARANAAPEISNLVLQASSPNGLTTDDLICTYDLEGDATTAAITWYKDATPLMTLYTPFEGGLSNALLDLSGNNHTVTAVGSPEWLSTGGHDGGGAFEFGPSFHLNAGEVFPTLSSYTKAAWVNMADPAASNNIMSSQSVDSGHVFYASQSQGNRLSAGHLGSYDIVQDPVPLDTGLWYHVAVSFDYTTGMMVLYKDGQEVDSGTAPEDKRNVTDATLLIGAFANGSAWNGLIDEAKLFDHVLSPEQILALYHGSDSIKSTETSTGEVWQAEVTPFSATEVGDAVASNTLTIGDPSPWVSGVTLAATSPGSITIDDLICDYQLEGSATTAAVAWYKDGSPLMDLYMVYEGGSSNALLDLSGSGQTVAAAGDVAAATAWDTTGGHDGSGAFHFTNPSGNRFFLDAGSVMSTGAYTKTCWLKRINVSGSSHNILSSASNAPGFHVLFAGGSAGGKVTAFHSGQALQDRVADTLLLVDNIWYHYVVTYDGATGAMILYRDGAQVASGTAPAFTDQTLYVGAFTENGNMWEGYLDDVRIYDHVLSSEQILALYHGSDTVKSTETSVGEQWYADVTPFSTAVVGTTVSSNTLQINEINAEIWMEPDTVYYQNSQSFNLSTYCDSELVGAKVFHFELSFDPSVVVTPADSVTLGSMFAGDDTVTVLFSQLWIDSTHLEIDIAYLRDSATLNGPGEIMVLPVVPTGFGQTNIMITNVLIFDRYNQQIPVNPVGSTYARICQFVGDVNASNGIDISDLVYLVDYMFRGGPVPLPSVWSANFNCDESAIDISDLVSFVDWMFRSGPFLCDPPCVQ